VTEGSIPITEKRFFVPSPAPRQVRETPLSLAEIAVMDSQIDQVVLGGPALYNLSELAEHTGWTVEEVKNLWLWAGLVIPDLVEPVFTENDVEGMRRLRIQRDSAGIDDEALSTMMRSVGSSLERLASWQVEDIVQFLIRKFGMSDSEARLEAALYAPTQVPALREQVSKIWGRHFAAALHRLTTEALVRRGLTDRDQQFPLLCGIGVATMVDFIEHTLEFGLADYANFVRNFQDQISDIVANSGGRVIKTLSDAIVYVTPNAEIGATIALQIAQLNSTGFPAAIRTAFIWCRVMQFHGDFYGPGVNLARLLSQLVPPNEVYIDQPTAEMLQRQAQFQLEVQPPLEIKGLGLVEPVRVTSAD